MPAPGRAAAEHTCAVSSPSPPSGCRRRRRRRQPPPRCRAPSARPAFCHTQPGPHFASAVAPKPHGPAPAPEVVAGGAEHAGTLAGPRGSSRHCVTHPSRTRTFRSPLPALCVTLAAPNEQEVFACSAPLLTRRTNPIAREAGRAKSRKRRGGRRSKAVGSPVK